MPTLPGTLSTRLAAAVPSPTARRLLGVATFAVLTALAARLAIPLPGTPVPFTFQVFAVLLAGAMLGPRLGAASQLAYLSAGAAGLPVFAAGGGLPYLLGPTGGYLLAYPLAALAVGTVIAGSPSLLRQGFALGLGVLAIYAGGVSWLAAWGGVDAAVALGVKPFLLADMAKAAMVLLLVRRYGAGARAQFGG